MSFFSDISGFNEKVLKSLKPEYEKKEGFAEVDFCLNMFEGDSELPDFPDFNIDFNTFKEECDTVIEQFKTGFEQLETKDWLYDFEGWYNDKTGLKALHFSQGLFGF